MTGPGFEFLDDDGGPAGPEEQLPDHRRRPRWSARRRVALALAALVVIGGAVAARAATSGAPSSPSAAPTPTPSAPGPATPATPVAPTPSCGFRVTQVPAGNASYTVRVPVIGSSADCADPDEVFCPEANDGQSACASVTTLPAVVYAAIHQRFPQATVTSSRTDYIRENHNLWHRTVRVTTGARISLTIVAQQRGVGTPVSQQADDGGHVVTRGVSITPQLTVIVEAQGPSGVGPDFDELVAMARDARLIAV